MFGSVKPTASNSEKSPLARRSPRKSPITDATTPTISDSTTIEVSIWRRDAPIVRSVASSRVRWAIVIERELAMTNEPTKSAMPPNASRKPCKNVMNSLVSSASACACWAPVLTCVPGGRISSICDTSSASVASGFAATAISSRRPTLFMRRWAVGRSKPASVAPPIERPELNWMIPASGSSSTGPSTCTPIVSPTSKSSFAAVSLSTTISFGPGHSPSISVRGLNGERGFAIEKPRFGAPP